VLSSSRSRLDFACGLERRERSDFIAWIVGKAETKGSETIERKGERTSKATSSDDDDEEEEEELLPPLSLPSADECKKSFRALRLKVRGDWARAVCRRLVKQRDVSKWSKGRRGARSDIVCIGFFCEGGDSVDLWKCSVVSGVAFCRLSLVCSVEMGS